MTNRRLDVNIHALDFSKLEGILHVGVYGLPSMGKTRFLKVFVKYLVEVVGIKRVSVVVGNPDTAVEWYDVVPPLFIREVDKHSYEIERMYDYSSKKVADERKHHMLHSPGIEFIVPVYLQTIVVFDDAGVSDFLKLPIVQKMATQSRHAGLNTFWALQDVDQMKKAGKLHTHVALFQSSSTKHIEYIYREYSARLCTQSQFFRMYRTLASRKNHLMWIDNFAPMEISKKFMYYRTKGITSPVHNSLLAQYHKTHYLSDDKRKQVNNIHENIDNIHKKIDMPDDGTNWSFASQFSTLDNCRPEDIASHLGRRNTIGKDIILNMRPQTPLPPPTPTLTSLTSLTTSAQ